MHSFSQLFQEYRGKEKMRRGEANREEGGGGEKEREANKKKCSWRREKKQTGERRSALTWWTRCYRQSLAPLNWGLRRRHSSYHSFIWLYAKRKGAANQKHILGMLLLLLTVGARDKLGLINEDWSACTRNASSHAAYIWESKGSEMPKNLDPWQLEYNY